MLLKVEGISDHTGEDGLKELFSKVGDVESITIIRDIYTGRSRGFGFVEMPSQAEGESAIRSLNAFVLDGLQISVKAPKHQRLLKGEMEFKEWLTDNASKALRRVGLKEGMIIMDYGCGPGRFTIPSAKIVGRNGKVYAADANASALERVKKEAKIEGLENIETVLRGRSDLTTGLQDENVDAILVYDVMHEIGHRERLLKELHRVLKQNGFLSIFPMHMGTERMLAFMDQCHSFAFRDRYGPFGYKTESEILNFKKVNRSF
jgi:SAM-dependent methyltransferase